MARPLVRSKSDRILGGVCGGIAACTGMSTGLVRLITAILTIFWGAGLWIYLLAWIILPEEGTDKTGLDAIIGAFKSGPKNPDDLR